MFQTYHFTMTLELDFKSTTLILEVGSVFKVCSNFASLPTFLLWMKSSLETMFLYHFPLHTNFGTFVRLIDLQPHFHQKSRTHGRLEFENKLYAIIFLRREFFPFFSLNSKLEVLQAQTDWVLNISSEKVNFCAQSNTTQRGYSIKQARGLLSKAFCSQQS